MKARRALLLVLLSSVLASSCAYYNTFYLARKAYDRGTDGEPYPLDKQQGANAQDFTRAVDYSKKVLTQYPKSKWVDDAYLMWARGLLGQDDPLESIKMLEVFPSRFPKSPLINDAHFYLGVAYRQARKYRTAVRVFDEFLVTSPKNALAPYAHLERARALMSLDEPVEAAASASKVLERFPKSKLADRARIARADALIAAKQFDAARLDYQEMGRRSQTDDDRLKYLLREADCLEAAQQYPTALAILKDAISHEHEPLPPDTTGGRPAIIQPTPGYDRYGRLLTRIGTVQLHAGNLNEALAAYQRVVLDYPRDAIAAEAQFRVGYAYETLGDDFDKARSEYQRVKDQSGQVGFGNQATDRLRNLDRIAQFRSSTGDTAVKQMEAAFLIAEQYLFAIEKPERALEEYRKIVERFPGTPSAAKALNAEAWVLSRRLDRKAEADSLFWNVVHNYPATEAQLAARDYLEMSGKDVPADLIKLPEPVYASLDTASLTAPPDSMPPIGMPFAQGTADSLGTLPMPRPQIAPPGFDQRWADPGPGFAGDTPGAHSGPPRRSVPPPVAPRAGSKPSSPPPGTPADSTRRPVPPPVLPVPMRPDTTGFDR